MDSGLYPAPPPKCPLPSGPSAPSRDTLDRGVPTHLIASGPPVSESPLRDFEVSLKQIRQYLRNGALESGEVPIPAPGAGDVLIRSHYSFVSVGTEKMKVTQARMNLAEKARERPDQVRQVIQTLREQGV